MTQQEPEKRWGKNGLRYRTTPFFFSAIKEYGWDNFEHIILQSGLAREEACEAERYFIKKYRTQDKAYGYNVFEGGDTPKMPSEVKQKISNAMIGNKNNLGRVCPDETRKKISDALKGREFSDRHKKLLSDAAKSRHIPCSETKRKKLLQNAPNKKRVFCVETQIVYGSIHECARQLNLCASNVSKVCQGKSKRAGMYHLRYADE